jgi:hypothetical protein
MAENVTRRFMFIVVYVILTLLFFYWLLSEAKDLAYFFGFSTSEVVSSDIVGVGNSLGGVPGNATINYQWHSIGFTSGTNAVYDFSFLKKILCAAQMSSQFSVFTTDCFSFFYPVNIPELNNIADIRILFTKVYDTTDGLVKIGITKVGAGS